MQRVRCSGTLALVDAALVLANGALALVDDTDDLALASETHVDDYGLHLHNALHSQQWSVWVQGASV